MEAMTSRELWFGLGGVVAGAAAGAVAGGVLGFRSGYEEAVKDVFKGLDDEHLMEALMTSGLRTRAKRR